MAVAVHCSRIFCTVLRANVKAPALEKLHKLNHRLLRILQRKRFFTPINHLYVEYNVLPVSLLHEFKLLIVVHKCIYHKNLLPDILKSYFTQNSVIHIHDTRRISNLHLFKVMSSFGQRLTIFHSGKLWKNLPKDIKSCPSLNKCIKLIKQYT